MTIDHVEVGRDFGRIVHAMREYRRDPGCEHLIAHTHNGHYLHFLEFGGMLYYEVVMYTRCIRCQESFGGFVRRGKKWEV